MYRALSDTSNFFHIVLHKLLTIVAFLASLPVLVQNLTLRASLACAFKAINNNMSTFVSIESANYLIYVFLS